MSRKLAPCALLLAVAATARADGVAHPITNGTLDAGDPGVVGLLDGVDLYCTGTAISPRHIVTAGHCLFDDAPTAVFVGASRASGGTEVTVLDRRRHPGFDGVTFANDIAILFLAAPLPASAVPWPVSAEPLAASFVGSPLRLVGFGKTEVAGSTVGDKRVGLSAVTELEPDAFHFAPTPSQTCLGDSGGPAFAELAGIETLVGVTSRGDPACTTYAIDSRVDVHVAAFIEPYLAATAAGAAASGERCFEDATCADGTCYRPADQPAFAYCASPCTADADCADGMACTDLVSGDQCRWPAPGPGALGASCASAADCATDLCAADAEGAPGVCSVRCFVEDPAGCPDTFACAADVSTPGREACFPVDTAGGCDAGGHSGSGGLLLALLIWGASIRTSRCSNTLPVCRTHRTRSHRSARPR